VRPRHLIRRLSSLERLAHAPNPRRRPRRDAARAGSFSRRTGLACALLASLWAVVHYRSDIAVLFQSPPILQESEPGLLSGSLLYFPLSGNTCRQSLIDNATGQIRDNGFVDCDAAKAHTAKMWGQQMALQRRTAIWDSVVNK
jgi:hypothetical protein